MKRILMILLTICAISSVQAQNAPRGEKRDQIITENLLSKMIPVNRKFAITRTPISYYLIHTRQAVLESKQPVSYSKKTF